ncbi:MAG: acyltransferase [Proteobacteria bacterium]|nr:acyltransferase [Pseudomonadota bacterium]
MPAISIESSLRLRLLNFPLIIGVVYIHAYSATIEHAGVSLGPEQLNYFTDFVRILISQGLARLAVPLFFLMSGYFFFLGFTWSWRGLEQKLAARVKTLLVPYLFWTVLAVATRFLGQSIPAVKAYFTGDSGLLADLSVYDLVNAVLGLTRPPEAYHLWFIRDLMLLMLLSPLIIFLLRNIALPFLGVMFFVWITAKWPIYSPDAVGVLFFSLGSYMAMKGKSLFVFDKYGKWFVLAYLPVLLADVIWYDAPFNLYLHRCGIVIGLVAILFGSKMILAWGRLKNLLLWLSGLSFFVYAAHEPLLGITRTLAFQLLPLNWPYTVLLIYLFVPLGVVAVLVGVHAVLGALIPGVLRVVNGGR